MQEKRKEKEIVTVKGFGSFFYILKGRKEENMSDLPEPNQSRIESYLGEIADQEGAEMPPEPLSRVEQYLEYIAENGGSRGSGILVGNVKAGDSFPIKRPDGSVLQLEDYVRPASDATFPFAIDGVEFTSKRDKAYYSAGGWMLDPGVFQDTSETPVKTPAEESISGTKTKQSLINKEIKDEFGKVVHIPTDTISLEHAIIKKSDGTIGMMQINSNANAPNAIVRRDNDGQLNVPLTPLGDDDAASKKYVDEHSGGNSLAQYTTMPTASADNVGKIVQYIGVTDTEYTNGFIYVCISQAGTPVTYSWVRKTVQNDAVDNETIGLNSSDEKYVKDNSISLAKFKTQATTEAGKVPKVKADGTWELGEVGGGTDTNAVHYTADTKTETEKTQARSNIGASKVAVSTTGTATTEAKYITVDDTEYKIPEGGSGSVEIDNLTIVKNSDNELETSIGGYIVDAPEDSIYLTEGEATKTGDYTFVWATPSADIKRLYEEVAVNDIQVSISGEIDGVEIEEGTGTGTCSAISADEVRWVVRYPAEELFRLYVTYNHSTETATVRALTTNDANTVTLNCKYVVSPAQTVIQPIDGNVVPMNADQFRVDSHGDICLDDMINIDVTATELTDDEVEFIQSHENIVVRTQVDDSDIYLSKFKVEGDEYVFIGMSENGGVLALTLNTDTKAIAVASTQLSAVSVSGTGTSTDEVQYITINDTEYKLAGGGGSVDIDHKTIIKDAEDKLTTAVGGYDTRRGFEGDIVREATATETSTKMFEFDINETTKGALSTTFKSAPSMKVAMYNKVTIAGTAFEHRMTVTVNRSEDGVWTVTLYLEMSGVDIPVPIEINANTGKMKCDFTAVPSAYPIDSVFATASTVVNIGELSYIDNKFIKYDDKTVVEDLDGTLKAVYGGGREATSTESISGLVNVTATYTEDIETFKLFALSSHSGESHFTVGNKVDISFNFNGEIVSLTDAEIVNCYEEAGGSFAGVVLDSILGSKSYFLFMDSTAVVLSETVTSGDALICKGCTIKYVNYTYSPVESKYVPYSDRFFYADSTTDLILPKVQFGTWEEGRELFNHNGGTEFTTTSNFILFEANRENTVRAGNYVNIGYSVNHATLGRVRAEACGTFVQHSSYDCYALLADMHMGDDNIFQNIRIFTNTTPATIQLQLVNEIAIEDIVSIDEMMVRQIQYDDVDHPIASKYLKLDADMLAVNGSGEVYVKISAETGNSIQVKSDGLFASSGGGTTDHSDLENLGYSESGHTGFQASISDLETIRTGAAAGATAYQKPSGGIPATDLAESYSKKPTKVTSITAGAVTLADNTEYVLTDVTAMAISFPASGDYACWFRFNTAATGTINITFPSGTKYVGSVPAFSNNQQWMMYIENGMVVANKAV